LENAVLQLYETAVVSGSRTSTQRLQALADFCVSYLTLRGLEGAQAEADIQGGGRTKSWDVAWKFHDKYRLAISLKSLLNNVKGASPNRIDDLIGEVANAQMYSPEIVTGYIIIMDVAYNQYSQKHGRDWIELMEYRLASLSGRTAPAWGIGMIEAYCLVKVDFSHGPRLLSKPEELIETLNKLILETARRNPSILLRDVK